MFHSSVIDNFYFELFEKREFFMKIRALQGEIQRLKNEAMYEMPRDVVDSVTNFELKMKE